MKVAYFVTLLLVASPALLFAGEWVLDFDGQDNWVEIQTSPLESGDIEIGFTYEGWILVREPLVENQIYYNGPVIESNVGLDPNGELGFGIKFADAGWQAIFAPFEPGTWLHFAAIYNRPEGRMSLYLNGVLAISEDTISSLPFSYHSIGIGTYAPAPEVHNLWLDGQVDCIRISEGVLYTEDFTPPLMFDIEPTTLALWDMEEGEGVETLDLSGNGHDGSIIGATWVEAPTAADFTSWSFLKALF